MRRQIAVVVTLWLIAELWIAYYWWDLPDFQKNFTSAAFPVLISAIVLASWLATRSFVKRIAQESRRGKVRGIIIVIAATVIGALMPLMFAGLLAYDSNLSRSFMGDAGMPALACTGFLLQLGFIFCIVVIVEILRRRISRTF